MTKKAKKATNDKTQDSNTGTSRLSALSWQAYPTPLRDSSMTGPTGGTGVVASNTLRSAKFIVFFSHSIIQARTEYSCSNFSLKILC